MSSSSSNRSFIVSFFLAKIFILYLSICNKHSLRELQTVVQAATDGFRV
jgi:hypothetical protein